MNKNIKTTFWVLGVIAAIVLIALFNRPLSLVSDSEEIMDNRIGDTPYYNDGLNPTSIINVGTSTFRITTSNNRPIYTDSSPAEQRAGVFYDTDVYKNSMLVDSIRFERPKQGQPTPETKFTRTYSDGINSINVTFGDVQIWSG